MNTIIRWDPVRESMNLRRTMERLMEDGYGWSTQDSGERVARLPIDAYTTADDIVITASVPGLKPEDVEIMVEGDALTIRGELNGRVDGADYVLAERFHGRFSRVLNLNVPIEVDDIKATFENGILTLVLPKAEEIKPKVIKVEAR